MPTHSHPSRRLSESAALVALVALVALAVAAGFLLFPGCSSRCCPTAPPAGAPPMPSPTPSAPAAAAASPSAAAPVGDGSKATPAPAPSLPAAAPAPSDGDALAASRVHNYFRLSKNVASGASPEADADFAALAAAGVKSIVSVDGARPDAEAARKHGLRYVHIPIGYDGISDEKRLEFAKTFAELGKLGPVFVHCHHGKHRGPAACAIARVMLDGATHDEVVAEMKRAGTAPKYEGLYEVARTFERPSDEALEAASAPMPEAAPTPAMQQAMVLVDATWERLKLVKAAGWAVPPDHPDVAPSHEATILAEHYREMARLDSVAKEPEGFRKLLAESEASAWALSKALEKGALDAATARREYDRLAARCTDCHTAYRDNVHRR